MGTNLKSRQFREGFTYVFTKKKYLKRAGADLYRKSKGWADKCNGREVSVMSPSEGIVDIVPFKELGCTESTPVRIHPNWCKCIEKK